MRHLQLEKNELEYTDGTILPIIEVRAWDALAGDWHPVTMNAPMHSALKDRVLEQMPTGLVPPKGSVNPYMKRYYYRSAEAGAMELVRVRAWDPVALKWRSIVMNHEAHASIREGVAACLPSRRRRPACHTRRRP
jgi:hypothetical protein